MIQRLALGLFTVALILAGPSIAAASCRQLPPQAQVNVRSLNADEIAVLAESVTDMTLVRGFRLSSRDANLAGAIFDRENLEATGALTWNATPAEQAEFRRIAPRTISCDTGRTLAEPKGQPSQARGEGLELIMQVTEPISGDILLYVLRRNASYEL